MAGIWLFFAAIGVGTVLTDHTPGGLIGGGALLIAGLFLGLRALVSHARLTPEGLVYVGYGRTHRLPWTEVVRGEIVELDSALPVTTVGVVVHLSGGTEVGLPAMSGFARAGRNRRLQRLVRGIDERRGEVG